MTNDPPKTVTADGIALSRLYTEAPALAVAQRASSGWETLALIDPRRGDLTQAVERARQFGAHGLWLRSESGWTAEEVLAVAEQASDLRLVLASSSATPEVLAQLSGVGIERLELSCDPISVAMRHDAWEAPDPAYETATKFAAESLEARSLCFAPMARHAAGGDPVDELVLLATSLLEFARRTDLPAAALHDQNVFQLAVGPHLVTEIAKFRAAREILARLVVSLGADAADVGEITLHAVTSPRTLTVRGFRNNALRVSGQVAAAVLGGADRVTVLPWDDRLQEVSARSDRLALQLQNVLRSEARLDGEVDPGAGSFAIEALSDQLGRAAWELAAEVEAEGGAWESLRQGRLRQRLTEARDRRRQQVADGGQPILGVTSYPDPEPAPPALERVPASPFGAFFDEPPQEAA